MKKLQEQVKKFEKKYGLISPPEHRMLDLVSEVGEVAKEVLKMTDYGRKPEKYREEIELELGDVLYSLASVANYYKVDLEDTLKRTLVKYEKRLKKGSAGSEND
ncbi:MAG: MazG-like family protein [Patescibacteria group bacterium]